MSRYILQGGFRAVLPLLLGSAALIVSPISLAQRPVIPEFEAPKAADLPLPAEVKEIEELDEVIVRGGRLYDRIVRAEDRFFEVYNELNQEDDFDIHCASVPIGDGSRIEQRFCMPEFFADAKAEQVRLSQYCLSLESKDEEGNVLSQGACYEPPTAEQLFFARREEYVKNLLKVSDSNSVLKKMFAEVEGLHAERATLEKRFLELKEQEIAEAAKKNSYRPVIRR